MIVVRLSMWPSGSEAAEYPIAVGSLNCIGQATRTEGDVREGERAYRVRLYRDAAFGGPATLPAPDSKIWRQGIVRGHMPGPRGAWDLVGGALHRLLDPRLDRYVVVSASVTPEEIE